MIYLKINCFIKENVSYTEEGHHCLWYIMLRFKGGTCKLLEVREGDYIETINIDKDLSEKQKRLLSKYPNFILFTYKK